MTLGEDIFRGGCEGIFYLGHFSRKLDQTAPVNGNGKALLPYQIEHLHPGKNPSMTLARVRVYSYQNENYEKVGELEVCLGEHLRDPRFDPERYHKRK